MKEIFKVLNEVEERALYDEGIEKRENFMPKQKVTIYNRHETYWTDWNNYCYVLKKIKEDHWHYGKKYKLKEW